MSEVKKHIVVGTYNMSFASDQGKAIGSEGRFLRTQVPRHENVTQEIENAKEGKSDEEFAKFKKEMEKSKDSEVNRTYWNNALAHLENFITNHTPLAVGLQEMNLTEKDSDQGTDAVEKKLPDGYKIYSKEVTFKFGKPAVSLIVNTNLAGEIKPENIEVKDNMKQLDASLENPFGGRPILMALTDKNILLVSMHGMQHPSNGRNYDKFNTDMIKGNKEELESLVKTFLENKTTPVAAYVMGDFNDRYDSITKFNFEFGDATYSGESPASCCHNFDSMGKKEKLKLIGNQPEDKYKQGPDPAKQPQYTIPEDHGINIEHYINKGDKVFAWPNAGNLEIYTGDESLDAYKKKPSDKSDHELVFMTIKDKTAEEAPAAEATEPAATEEAEAPATTAAETTTEAPAQEGEAPSAEGGFFKSLFGGKKKTKKRKSSKKKTKKKRKGKRKGGTKKLNTTHKK